MHKAIMQVLDNQNLNRSRVCSGGCPQYRRVTVWTTAKGVVVFAKFDTIDMSHLANYLITLVQQTVAMDELI